MIITDVAKALDSWLEEETEHTCRAYKSDLKQYAIDNKSESWIHAVQGLLESGPKEANSQVKEYARKLARRMAPATVKRKLSTLRLAVTAARKQGLVNWHLEVDPPKPKDKDIAKSTAARLREGVDLEELRRVRVALAADRSDMALRDRAIIELAATPPYLRCFEIVQLDIGDLDFRKKAVCVLGKARVETEHLPLSPIAITALKAWLTARGKRMRLRRTSPVFIRMDKGAKKESRLTVRSVYNTSVLRGLAAGIPRMRPHGLRHHGLTVLANHVDANGLPIGEGMKLSRHAKEETWRGYVDRTGTMSDKIVEAVSKISLGEKGP